MIRIAAHARGEDGWGRHSRGLASALARFEPTELVDFQDLRPARAALWRRWQSSWRSSVGVCLGELSRTFMLNACHRVAYYVGETTRIPRDTLFFLERADMVWTPSHWGRGILEAHGMAPARIGVVPEGVDSSVFRPPDAPRPRSGPFRFLCVAKWEERKGTGDLVRVFLDEFRSGESAQLVMRCDQGGAVPADPRIVWTGPVDLAGLVALMQSCDAFVLPTRGEGWGLPVLEAMACGLPCIVTGYSGITEFAHPGNSFPIMASMCPVDDPRYYDPRRDWGEWARPDRDHLRRLMRFVYENPAEAACIAQRAREEAVRLWSWDRAAEAALRHVRALRAGAVR